MENWPTDSYASGFGNSDNNYRVAVEREYIEELRAEGRCVNLPDFSQNQGLMPQGALIIYTEKLSPYEKIEILNYENIYAIPMNDYKLMAPENAIETGFFKKKRSMMPGDHIHYRFTVNEIINSSKPIAAVTDNKTMQRYAVKMISYHYTAYADCKTLMRIEEADTERVSNCVRMFDYGHFRGTHFIVMDLYDMDVRRYLNEHHPTGIPLLQVGSMSRSIIHALDFLKRNQIVHANIEPSNIVFNVSNPNAMKLAGFGSSRLEFEDHSTKPCPTMQYRSPEGFMKSLPYCATDMWSFACVVAEMVTNKLLISGDCTKDQFYALMELIGNAPKEFMKFNTQEYFYSSFKETLYPKHVQDAYKGPDFVCHMYTDAAQRRKLPGETPLKSIFTMPEEASLLDFLKKALKWLPESRITPENALDHEFFVVLPDLMQNLRLN